MTIPASTPQNLPLAAGDLNKWVYSDDDTFTD